MKIVLYVAFAILALGCSNNGTETIPAEARVDLEGLTSSIGEITSTSIALQYSYSNLTTNGGNLVTEIWYKKLNDGNWSILEVPIENQKVLEINNLERGTTYLAKPVFKVNDFVKEGAEIQFRTLPFNYTFVREGNPNSIWITNIFADDDYTELGDNIVLFLKRENDSIPTEITVISKDSLWITAFTGLQTLFDSSGVYEERLEASLTLQFNDYYNGSFSTVDLFNPKPRINALSFQKTVSCSDLDKTKLLFQGFFWDSSLRTETDFNKPDDYQITITNIEDPLITIPVYTQLDQRFHDTDDVNLFLSNNCEVGFTIVEDPPIRNLFHRGSFMWVSFPTEILPEGMYRLQFSVIKNGDLLSAEPFEFSLRY
ncbi:hypothetical protein [Ulvibacterium marinum]|uniref:Uncharacterized protein n=1 Tax=Ulvibacterium marinum TaxID=2419782 RepID=A0A3B0CEW0_9FLAO|nr:hypothetical protein [Ulvibacterium marinum]RKN82579.1 hypothetical protein D7Z94_01680 [Ulvibacterium marinum]